MKTQPYERLRRAFDYLSENFDGCIEWADEYGEPDYKCGPAGVLFANWNDIPKRVQSILERLGFELEWSDEWYINGGRSPTKAYRTCADSHGWQPTAVYSEACGDYLTPDDGADCAIESFASDSSATVSAVPYWVTDADLQAAGFVCHGREFENGFHPGQTDEPRDIAARLLGEKDTPALASRVVGRIDASGQFDVRFSVWFEPAYVRPDDARDRLPAPTFDRLDICEAWSILESDYNEGGWLHERESNQRRNEACAVQLDRMKFRPRPSLEFRTLTDNGKAIYLQAVARLGLPDPEFTALDLQGASS